MTTFTKEQLIKFANAILQTETAMVSWDCMAGQQAKAGAAIAEVALASLEAEPVAFSDKRNLRDVDGDSTHTARMWGKYNFEVGDMALYAAPPAPVVPDELLSELLAIAKKAADIADECAHAEFSDDSMEHSTAIADWEGRAAMQGKAEPVSNREELVELIEGMEVSVDVSTCDADAGHRYFGTVTEISELDGAKNGYILLVHDAEPNFTRPGNSPVIPDGWVACSERMPEVDERDIWLFNGEAVNHGYVWDGSKFIDWDEGYTQLIGVTHWMPMTLPSAPQQEVKSALSKGMERYGDAMQWLAKKEMNP